MRVLILLLLMTSDLCHGETSTSGILLNQAWQKDLYAFAKQHFQHSAWGIAHYERNYLMTKLIAEQEGIAFDSDVVFAAAFLHDLGVFEPYVIAGAEHANTAVTNIEHILTPIGFPMEKIARVKALISGHMFYAHTGDDLLVQAFHDADTLDFLGVIGIMRIVSVTTRHRWATDLPSALKTVERFSKELPAKLVLTSSRTIAENRIAQSQRFLQTLRQETNAGLSL